VTKGALQGTSITYNDYFNESSDEGSYIESEEEVSTGREGEMSPAAIAAPLLSMLQAPN
jgi:hypothetical protein